MLSSVCTWRTGRRVLQGEEASSRLIRIDKSLVSQVISGWALPRKVVIWLLDGECFSDLVPGCQKTATSEGSLDTYCTKEGWKQVRTCWQGEQILLEARTARAGRYIYKYGSDGGKVWQALSYPAERKQWVRNATGKLRADKEGVLPEAIVAIVPSTEVSGSSPRTPESLNLLFPSASGTTLAEIQQQSNHRFKNSELLAEALAHYSAQSKLVRSNGRLALAGAVVWRLMSRTRSVREASFFGSHLLINYKEASCWERASRLPQALHYGHQRRHRSRTRTDQASTT